jgi:hypothetical protein
LSTKNTCRYHLDTSVSSRSERITNFKIAGAWFQVATLSYRQSLNVWRGESEELWPLYTVSRSHLDHPLFYLLFKKHSTQEDGIVVTMRFTLVDSYPHLHCEDVSRALCSLFCINQPTSDIVKNYTRLYYIILESSRGIVCRDSRE